MSSFTLRYDTGRTIYSSLTDTEDNIVKSYLGRTDKLLGKVVEIEFHPIQLTILVERSMYDQMVQRYPDFMATYYVKLQRRWSLAGVTVCGPEPAIKLVKQMVEAISYCNIMG